MGYSKTEFRRERAVRMELAGLPDLEIATRIGLTHAGFTTMKQTPEYKELRDQIRDGLVTELDLEFSQDIKSMKDKMRAHVPAALQVLLNTALQQKDPKLAYTAAKDIIEYDGNLVAPLKSEIAHSSKMTKADEDAVNEIIAARDAAALPQSVQ